MTDDRQAWQPLLDELDRWSEAGNVATFWWRDDDAIEPTFALDRMLALVNRFQVPLGLAVIPATATPQLADRLRNEKLVEVLQHGYRHKNHANPGERAAEFGPQRTFDVSAARSRQVASFLRISIWCRSSCPPGTVTRRPWSAKSNLVG